MKIYLETYGCTANKSDERLLIGLLKQNAHEIVESISQADILVLLSCTVIATTEQRMLSRLKVFKQTQKKIVVTGCMASVQKDLIYQIVPNALVLSPQYIQYINNIIQGEKPVFIEMKKTNLPKQYSGIIAPIMIAEGCKRSCAYCITSHARGALRSFPVQEIVTDVSSAIRQGCKEIQLTAQDTASYGLDSGTNLGFLLACVCSLNEAFRIRVGMMNPATLKQNLQPILAAFQHEKIFKFLHLPVQSGDDSILEKMNRGYRIQEFSAQLCCFRKKQPDITISTDVIVGFPTETEEQFDNTIKLIQNIQPDIINITRFSARPHTTAKNMPGRVPTHIVKQRSKKLSDICSTMTLKKNKHLINSTALVLITENNNNTFSGRTETYKPVVLSEQVAVGDFVQVRIVDATQTHLVGKLI